MRPNRSTRRHFLRGSSVLAEFDAQGDAELGATPAGSMGVRALLTVACRRAMACDWEVQFPTRPDDGATEHVLAALDLIETLEGQMSVYRGDSEVTHINNQAAEKPVSVESRLFSVFELAGQLHQRSGGAFDITSGPLSDAWGFSRRRGRAPHDGEIAAALARVGMRHVVLDAGERTIAFLRRGVAINLHSVGKGYALDRMSELLDEAGVGDYLIHGGKSSVFARGTRPGGAGGWPIGLRHPLRPSQRLAEFRLEDYALSTSGSGTQFFRRHGRTYGHILDPRTGWPAQGIYSATVLAPTAAEADALSTAFYVMGPDKVADYCRSRPELAALLVTPGAREGEARLHAFNLNESRWRPMAS